MSGVLGRRLAAALLALVALASSAAQAEVLNVKSQGAVGNGVADDTDALQRAIDAAITSGAPASTTRTGKMPLYVPKGTYNISLPLKIWSVSGLQMYGDGDGTWIRPTVSMAAALDLNGVAYSSFSDFLVASDGVAVATSVIQLRWDNVTAARSTTQNTFRNIRVGGKYVNGWEIGSSGSNLQTDNDSFFHCYAAGAWASGDVTYWQNGFLVGTGSYANNLIHSFYKITSIHNRNGFKLSATQAAIYGGDLEDNEVDLNITTTSYFYAGQIRSETSERLLVTGGPATYATAITLQDIDWKANTLNADGYWIKMLLGGSLSLSNVRCYDSGGAGSSATTAQIDIEHADTTVIADGLAVGGTDFSPTVSQAFRLLGANTGAIVTGYTQLGAGATIAGHVRGPTTLSNP